MKDKSQARICVPVCVSLARDIAPAIARAEEFADVIELRLDCLTQSDFYQVERDLAELCQQSSRPVIFTLRPKEQGGRRELEQVDRFLFWSSEINRLLTGNENYADVELDVALGLMRVQENIPAPDWNRVICSYHDFTGVPAELEKIYEQMAQTKARIIKIAIQANDITDCLPMFSLLERARLDGRELIAIAMGEAGITTRILGPARGSFLTYGSLDAEQATAPGQIAATELRDLYRIHRIDSRTEIFGLVGNPVAHSVSPQMHNAACAASQLNAVYIPFEVRNLDDFMRRMVQQSTREIDWKLRGLSVTAPHKSAVMRHLDWIEPSAQEIGAVNTILIEGEGLYGYNTDAQAALAPLTELIDLNEARVAVIGAGGAARALLWSLREACARVTVFARNLERATETARQFGASCESLDGAQFGGFAVVVNATPLGTRGLSEDTTPAIANQLRGASIAYDLVYNPCETRFMREALTAGCQSVGGLQMLVAQAAAQFKLWTGQDAPVEAMREAARKALMSDA